jgi:hypothetical protein
MSGSDGGKYMSDSSVPSTNMIQELLADPEGRRMFVDAVGSALQTYGDFGHPYNIDSIERLAASIESHKYAAAHMVGTPRFTNASELLRHATGRITRSGPILEFGVFRGGTINRLASLAPSFTIYGFDSFEGLPEAWSGTAATKGTFSLEGKLPDVRENVELVVGRFDKTLPFFLDSHDIKDISLLHVDCDIYSSTQCIFANLYERIVPGTIIVFDEYFNYPGWERHEFRAFQEFTDFRRVRYEYIGLVPSAHQVAVRIL